VRGSTTTRRIGIIFVIVTATGWALGWSVMKVVLHSWPPLFARGLAGLVDLDPEHESDRARKAFDSHLSRAKWMTEHGYRHLLRGGASA
jgi:drug/metabolite transporter (DMT)-like permease